MGVMSPLGTATQSSKGKGETRECVKIVYMVAIGKRESEDEINGTNSCRASMTGLVNRASK